MGEVRNYLDIQLRDMDYENNYPGNLRLKFLDLEHKYRDDDAFERKYNVALEKAKETLDLKMSKTKVENDPVVKALIAIYKQRLEKEKRFIAEWEKIFDISRKNKTTKVAYPLNGDYTLSTSRAYAFQFSHFIETALGAEDNEIIKCLRSDQLAESVSGLASKVFSSRAAEGHKSNKKNQSDINLYYENLFTTFFFGKRISKNKYSVSLEDMTKKGASTVGAKAFKQNFINFIDLYYSPINSDVAQRIKDGVRSLEESCAENIYKNFNGKNPKYFIFTRDQSRGVSELTEQQLKKMLLQTVREICKANGGKLEDYSIPGVLEVNSEWRDGDGKFNAVVQVKIDEKKKQRSELRKAKEEGRLVNGEKVDFRKYNRTYFVKGHEDDMVEGLNGDMVQIKQLFLDFITQKIEGVIGRKMEPKEIQNLSRAFFQKIDKTIKRGDRALDAMSAYGPVQMKGLLGEVATAYALQIGSEKVKDGIYTEITGGDRAGVGGQLNYDVVARIANSTVGFQVKNYKPSNSTRLYEETVHLGRKEMFKYFKEDDVKSYRWLFANGVYLTEVGDIPDLRKKMEMSFFGSINNFLRISDASIDKGLESDIYVIGQYYFPSSFLIAAAINKVKQQLEKQDDSQRLFQLNGTFPAYRQKAKPKYVGTKEYADGTTKDMFDYGNVGMKKKNIMYIKNSRVLDGGEIYFRGITINFTI